MKVKTKFHLSALLVFAISVLAFFIALALILNGIPVFGALAESMPETADSKEVDVWLIGGQSNAVGYGSVESYPSNAAYAEYKALLTNGSQNVWYYGKDDGAANDPSDFVPTGFGLGQVADRSGAEIGIATALNGGSRMNAVIKSAYCGTAIYPNTTASSAQRYGTWTPPSYIERNSISTENNKIGVLYQRFIDTAVDGLNKLIAKGYTPVIRGMWWMQGEAESGNITTASAYEELLTDLINDVRSDLTEASGIDCSAMPFVFGRVYRNPDYPMSAETLGALQAAQDRVAADESLVNVFEINFATDLIDPVTAEPVLPVQHDEWHYDALSQQMIGEAFVRTISDGTYTKYGVIPEEYENAQDYPFAMFSDGQFMGAYTTLCGKGHASGTVFVDIWNVMRGAMTDKEIQVVLRRDYDVASNANEITFDNLGQIGGRIVLDLGRNTLTLKQGVPLLNVFGKYGAELETNVVHVFDSRIDVFGGRVVLNENVAWIESMVCTTSTQQNRYTQEKYFDVSFNGTEFIANSAAKGIVGTSNGRVNLQKGARFDIDLNDCTVDLRGCDNAVTLFKGSDSAGMNDLIVSLNGGSILADSMDNVAFKDFDDAGDTLYFNKNVGGEYPTITVPTGYTLPEISGINKYGVDVSFVNEGTVVGDTTVYTMVGDKLYDTPYGTIPVEYDVDTYPLAVFKDGQFIGAYSTFCDSAQSSGTVFGAIWEIMRGTMADQEMQIVLRRDYDMSANSKESTFHNLGQIGGRLVFDLGEHTVTLKQGTPFLYIFGKYGADLETGAVHVYDSRIDIYGGSFILNENVLWGASMVCNTATQIGRYDKEKLFDVSFNGTEFVSNSSAMGIIGTGTGTVNLQKGARFDIDFNDCVIDLRGCDNAVTLFKGTDSAGMNDLNVSLNGGSILADSMDNVIFGDVDDAGDTLCFNKNVGGNYPTITVPKEYTLPKISGINKYGAVVFFGDSAIIDGDNAVYSMEEEPLYVTPYGIIPNEYDAERYPFAVFQDGKFIGAYNTLCGKGHVSGTVFVDIWNIMRGEMKGKEVQIVLRRDYDVSSNSNEIKFDNLGQIGGRIVFDLEDHTLTLKSGVPLFDVFGKYGAELDTNVAHVFDSHIDVFGGRIVLNENVAWVASMVCTTATQIGRYDKEKLFDVSFNGTEFIVNSSAMGIIGTGTGKINLQKGARFDIDFNDCVIDLRGCGGNVTLFKGSDSAGMNDLNVTINGGNILADTMDNVTFGDFDDAGDTLCFGKNGNEKMITLTLPAGVSAPTEAFNTTEGEMFFTATENEGEYVLALKACEHVYDNACDTDCNLCGETRETEHNYKEVITAPDCVNGGFTTFTCANCGDSYVDNKTDALGHVYDNEFDADCNVCGEIREVASPAEGTCGTSATWRYENGVLYIEGTGSMNAYSSKNMPWIKYKNEITTVIVAEGIRSIGKCSFYEYTNLTSVTLPSTLRTINAYAFYGCTSLTEITLPASLTSIKQYAFRRSGLVSATFENDCGWYAGESKLAAAELSFEHGAALHLVKYGFKADWTRDVNAAPEVYNLIAMGYCGTNARWTLDNEGTLSILGSGIVINCTSKEAPWTAYKNEITKVVIGEGITKLGKSAFYEYANIAEVVLPSTLTEIGHYAFYGCKGLTEVTIPASVTTIGSYVFRKSGVTAVIFENTEGWSYRENAVDVTDAANVAYLMNKVSYSNVWSK